MKDNKYIAVVDRPSESFDNKQSKLFRNPKNFGKEGAKLTKKCLLSRHLSKSEQVVQILWPRKEMVGILKGAESGQAALQMTN